MVKWADVKKQLKSIKPEEHEFIEALAKLASAGIITDAQAERILAIKTQGDQVHNAQIENNFRYHAPKEGQPEKYTNIREQAKELAYFLDELCPNSREKSLALTKLEEAVMWANAAIARNE